jgi:hypothetical protein
MTHKEEEIERVTTVKYRYEKKLVTLANVVGVGVGFKFTKGQKTEILSVVANVSEKKPLSELAERDVVPTELDGIPTDVQEVGHIRAF